MRKQPRIRSAPSDRSAASSPTSGGADFACVKAKLVIEVDGHTHTTNTEIKHDTRRTEYMRNLGWNILRFWNDHIFKDIDTVLGEISDSLSSTALAGEVAEHREFRGGLQR